MSYKHILAIVFLLWSVSISAQPCFEICSGESVTLSHDVPGSTVTWYDVNSTVIGTGDQVVTPTATTSYYCIAVNDVDCTYGEPFYCDVVVNELFIGDIPESFSPDGDGVDDEFCIDAKCLDNYEIQIIKLGRPSTLIFTSTNVDDCWDGTFNGVLQPAGSFVLNITSTQFNHNGFVTLIP